MAQYVDGFVLSVKREKLEEYKKFAKLGSKTWKKYGALDYKECMIDDTTPEGIMFPFPKMAKTKEDEILFFSYIVFKSRKHRDQVNAKVMKDPAMNPETNKDMKNMPFDMKRFAYGGFEVFVS